MAILILFSLHAVADDRPSIRMMATADCRQAISTRLKSFENATNTRIEVTYNGPGVLVCQVRAGIEPDILLVPRTFLNYVADDFQKWNE